MAVVRWGLATVVVGLVAGIPAADAGAQQLSRQAFVGELLSPVPDSSSGYRLAIDYRDPADPGGKPYAVERILQELPEGAAIDTSVPVRCAASDQQLQAEGVSACPEESIVGRGRIDVDTGAGAGPVPRVIESRLTVFNTDGAVILFTESTNVPGRPVRTSGRSAAGPRSFTSTAPPLPGAPPPEPFTAVKRVEVVFDAVSRDGRAFIRTPSVCPSGGGWTTTGTFTYRDGVQQTERFRSRCDGTGAVVAPPVREACPRAFVALARPASSARRLNRRRALGVALRVDGRVLGLRTRLVERGSGRVVASRLVREAARDRVVVLRRRSVARAGTHRLVVSGRDACGRSVRARVAVRLRP